MIDNNDSRYAFKWLKDDYLAIEESQWLTNLINNINHGLF
jgi:hypothetical protein